MRTLYRNGKVVTMDPSRPMADAFVVEGDRIVAVGAGHELDGLTAPGQAAGRRPGDRALARVIDLGGQMVVPGLIDAHVHFSWFSFLLTDVNLDGVGSLPDALALVQAHAAHLPAGGWVRGHGFNANLWERWPTAADLDSVSPDRPVLLTSKDGHSAWVNSLVLRAANVTASTENPAGGQVLRDVHGVPTGVFQENAQELLRHAVPERGGSELLKALRLGLGRAHAAGVTGAHCMDGTDCFHALQALQSRGELTLRFFKQIPQWALAGAVAAGLSTGFGNEWLRVGCLKLFADGSLGSQTAYMLEGFDGRPDYRGVATQTPDSLRELIGKAVAADIAVAVHAIGDAANRMVLDAFAEFADLSRQKGLRHRIEHAQLLTDADLRRFAELDIIASVQPSHAPSDRYVADQFWGERSRLAYAFRSLLETGARLACGSDVPVEPLDPLAGIHAAVWRKRISEPESQPWYPAQRLTVQEALHGFTMGAAYASGEEQIKGSITPGKLADFVVLTHDILGGDQDEEVLRMVRPRATVLGGRLLFGEL